MRAPDRGPGALTVEAHALVVGYGGAAVLGPVDLQLGPGVTALLGRNGAGKTTLMRTLCGVIPAVSGRCTVFGAPVRDGAVVRSRVGYLGHELALASELTVEQNLTFWRAVRDSVAQATLIEHDALVEQFDLNTILNQRVRTLSRGQRQRVDLARLAMTDPDFVVLDEPLTGLDPVYAARMRELLREWGTTRTVLYSTHSVPEALELAQRYLVVQGTDLIVLGEDGAEVNEQMILNHLGAAA
ncbi:ABC transporter ATP-binding protein [Kocuria sp. CH-021]|uniref:ABC transporter ATP-binding protein n=1 Tax=Kocuria sp. CH-021 TaxID=3406735 RepID=UPI003C77AFAE